MHTNKLSLWLNCRTVQGPCRDKTFGACREARGFKASFVFLTHPPFSLTLWPLSDRQIYPQFYNGATMDAVWNSLQSGVHVTSSGSPFAVNVMLKVPNDNSWSWAFHHKNKFHKKRTTHAFHIFLFRFAFGFWRSLLFKNYQGSMTLSMPGVFWSPSPNTNNFIRAPVRGSSDLIYNV